MLGPRSPQRVTGVRPKHSRVTPGAIFLCPLKPTVPEAGINTPAQTNQLGLSQFAETFPRTATRGTPRAPGVTGAGRRSSFSRSWRTLTIKERASACPGGIPSAGRSGTPEREVYCRCCPLRGARATPRMLASPPAARPLGLCPAAAPSLPAGCPGVRDVLGEVGAQARQEGSEVRSRLVKRPTAPISGGRGSWRPGLPEAWRLTRRAVSPALRAHGPHHGRRSLECPASSPAPRAHAAMIAAVAGAGAVVRSSPSPGAERLCAPGAPTARASSGCCSRRPPLLLHGRPLPAFPAGPEAAAESRSG